MNKKPKYIHVLKYMYEKRLKGNWYTSYEELRNIVFDDKIVEKYIRIKRPRLIIDIMVCSYMGKLNQKGLINIRYSRGYFGSEFQGYYITEKGINLLKNDENGR